MSDDQDKTAEDKPEVETPGPVAGERLAEARRERQISVIEVAKELHLDEPKVRALERNEFEVLGAPVFAKGHLRKYAGLVGVDPDDILEDYYKMTHQDGLPPVVVARRRMRQEMSPGPWIAVIVVIIVVAAAYWWFAVFATQSPPETAPAEAPGQQQEPLQEAAPAEPGPDAGSAEAAPETVRSEPAAQPGQVPAESEPTDGQTRIVLTFSGDCWTEVADATGRRLFWEMGRAGNSVELAGVAPFAVLLGNVDNVQLLVNGNAYPVSSSNPGSRMARLTIVSP